VDYGEELEEEVGGATLGLLEELLDEIKLDQKTALNFIELVREGVEAEETEP